LVFNASLQQRLPLPEMKAVVLYVGFGRLLKVPAINTQEQLEVCNLAKAKSYKRFVFYINTH
jgi:hypothetical protein